MFKALKDSALQTHVNRLKPVWLMSAILFTAGVSRPNSNSILFQEMNPHKHLLHPRGRLLFSCSLGE